MVTVASKGREEKADSEEGARRSPWLCTDTVNGSILARPVS